jgi:hypothetical protein
MTRILAIGQRHALLLLVAFLVGGLFGLVVLGWYVWPVEWTEATPADLSVPWQRTYLAMTAEAYALTGDAVAARERANALVGPNSSQDDIAANLQAMIEERTSVADIDGAARLQALWTALGAPATEPGSSPAPPVAPSDPGLLMSRLLRVCGLVILVLVILAGLLLLVYFLQSRTTAGADAAPAFADEDEFDDEPAPAFVPPPVAAASDQSVPFGPTLVQPPPEGQAVGPFVATYNLGDVDFDMSFGIESATGDFLGECGLGMAETIGGGDVQRVTAFEVWLFDKTDIRTVSVVLASAYAHSDAALRTKLASRGDIVLAQPGAEFSVKTSSLKLEGRILDMAYGSGDVPAQSYYTTFSVELIPVPLLPGQK